MNLYKILILFLNEITYIIGDWGLGPIPNPQSPIPLSFIVYSFKLF